MAYPNSDPFAQNPSTQNPYKAVGGQTFAGGPTNAILGMQKPFSYPNNNPRSVPGSSPGGNMGAGSVTTSFNASIPKTQYGSPLPFNPANHSFSAHYAQSGGLAAQAQRSGGMAGGGDGYERPSGGFGFGGDTAGGGTGQHQPIHGYSASGVPTTHADGTASTADDWYARNGNGTDAWWRLQGIDPHGTPGPSVSHPKGSSAPSSPPQIQPGTLRSGTAQDLPDASTAMAAYGGTVMHRAIVGDPQADGGPNPELVEAAGPIRVTPLRNMPQRQAHASWARLPHYNTGGTDDSASSNVAYEPTDDDEDNDGTADTVPPAPSFFHNVALASDPSAAPFSPMMGSTDLGANIPSPSLAPGADNGSLPPPLTSPGIHTARNSDVPPLAPPSFQNVALPPGFSASNFSSNPTPFYPMADTSGLGANAPTGFGLAHRLLESDLTVPPAPSSFEIFQTDPDSPLRPSGSASNDAGQIDPSWAGSSPANLDDASSQSNAGSDENGSSADDGDAGVSGPSALQSSPAEPQPKTPNPTDSKAQYPTPTDTGTSGSALTLDQALKNGNGTLSYQDLQKLNLTKEQSREIISLFTGQDPSWTPDKVKQDADFQPDSFGNSYNWFTKAGRLREQYPGKSDDEIAALESDRRNEGRAKLLLFEHAGGTDRDRFRLLDALYELGNAAALPLLVPGASDTPWVGSALDAELGDTASHAIRIGEAGGAFNQAGMEVGGSKMLVGKTYKVNIWGLFNPEEDGKKLLPFINSLKEEAAQAGAERLQIIGSHFTNPKLRSPYFVNSLAKGQGFSFQSADGRYYLSTPVTPK